MTTRLTRKFVRAYLATPLKGVVTPNQVTTARLLTGLLACLLLADGTRLYDILGGIIWTIGCFLDRVDGELARLWHKTSTKGHIYDVASDALSTILFFVAIGYGSPHAPVFALNYLPIYPFTDPLSMGIIAGVSVTAAFVFSQAINPLLPDNQKAWQGDGWMDLDDIPYFFGIIAFVDALDTLLLAACLGAPLFAVWAAGRWLYLFIQTTLRRKQ
ncbi:MAG: CDP-alcohol phosphatidyltransferase family protein [Alphaproteobacteria bacterium GM202ARS2]|nr:CDP-alcohol phosphatidyltransferase family protein [Alphaproteobacteria bacterium GM202ARS2]